MKKYLICSLILVLCLYRTSAQDLKTNVSVRSCVFQHPQEGDYAEIYFTAAANVLKFEKNASGLFQAGVEVQIMIMDGNTVSGFDKYLLNTPELADTALVNFSIIDQKRISMPHKSVSLEVKLTDIHDASNVFNSTEALLPVDNKSIAISDIQFVDSYKQTTVANAFTKNNFEMQPYTMDFFPSSRNKLIFYGEVYHTSENITDDQLLVGYAIRQQGNEAGPTKYYQYDKFSKAPVISFLKEFDITDLPSGNYNIFVEVRNKKNEVLTQRKIFFQRSKTGAVNAYENISMVNTAGTFVDDYSEEQLNYFLDVIKPLATADEAKLIASLTPRVAADMKKKFLYNFWLQKDIADPYAAWLSYLELVRQVNDNFGTPSKPGYKTDRGRVYLQYGPPYDRLYSVNEPGAYPYEIWFYDKLPDMQTKIGFAFYEPSLVTNDYVLLHSNARGELHDPRWKIRIYESVASPQETLDFDNTTVQDKLGGQRAIDIYKF